MLTPGETARLLQATLRGDPVDELRARYRVAPCTRDRLGPSA